MCSLGGCCKIRNPQVVIAGQARNDKKGLLQILQQPLFFIRKETEPGFERTPTLTHATSVIAAGAPAALAAPIRLLGGG